MNDSPDPKHDTDNRPLPEQEELARARAGGGAEPVGPVGPPPTMPPKIGDTIGKYKIEAVVGMGACGRVYRGYDDSAKREVAIKVLRDEVITTENRENLLREFMSEASTVANLH